MAAGTRILIVDDSEKRRDHLIELLRFDDVEVVGESTFGAAAFTWAQQLDVDVVIVSIEEPVARSMRTIEALATAAESWPVIGVSSHGDRQTMRKAMVSGVRDFLVLPVSAEELRATVINIHQVDRARQTTQLIGPVAAPLGTVITVAGFKGGIGKSSMASSIGVALAQQTQQHVALVDFDLQFGDAALMLDVVPESTIEDLVRDLDSLDPQSVQGALAVHASRLKVLAAPRTPEAADEITDESAGRVLEMLAGTNDFIVVDSSPHLDGISVAAMDRSTMVIVVVVPEIPCLRRTKAALTLMQSWGYTRDKVKLVVNRSNTRGGVTLAEIEQVLDYPIFAQVPEDKAVSKGIAIGTPVSMSAPKSRAGRATNDLARVLAGVAKAPPRQTLRSRLLRNGAMPSPRPNGAAAPRFGRQGPGGPTATIDVPAGGGFSDAGPTFSWDGGAPSSHPDFAAGNGHAPAGAHRANGSTANGHGHNGHGPNGNGHNGHGPSISFEEMVHAGPPSDDSVWFRRNDGKG